MVWKRRVRIAALIVIVNALVAVKLVDSARACGDPCEKTGKQCGGGKALCSTATVNQAAVGYVHDWPIKEPFERGITLICDGPDVILFGYETSSWTTTQDPCKTPIIVPSDGHWRAGAHSHPFFRTAEEVKAGIGCHGTTSTLTASQISQLNATNANFSSGDIAEWRSRTRPLYMRVPNGDVVKKLQGSTTGSYTVTTVYP